MRHLKQEIDDMAEPRHERKAFVKQKSGKECGRPMQRLKQTNQAHMAKPKHKRDASDESDDEVEHPFQTPRTTEMAT